MDRGQIEYVVQRNPFERLQIISNEHTCSTVSVLLSQCFRYYMVKHMHTYSYSSLSLDNKHLATL